MLGGGDVQRDRIAIATLELEAANLVRRREEVAEDITREVVGLVLDYEQLDRQAALMASQLESYRLRVAVAEAQYRTGQGSTTTMIGLWQQAEDLAARCQEQRIGQAQNVRELEMLTGDQNMAVARIYSDNSGSGCAIHRP